MRYLGIDYGARKIGLALSDEGGSMGFPHAIIANTPHLVDELCTLIKEREVGAIVMGESKTLGGGHNPIAQDAQLLAQLLHERTKLPVHFESEVFTSAEARRHAPEGAEVDASAAALILTSYLSRNHGCH